MPPVGGTEQSGDAPELACAVLADFCAALLQQSPRIVVAVRWERSSLLIYFPTQSTHCLSAGVLLAVRLPTRYDHNWRRAAEADAVSILCHCQGY